MPNEVEYPYLSYSGLTGLVYIVLGPNTKIDVTSQYESIACEKGNRNFDLISRSELLRNKNIKCFREDTGIIEAPYDYSYAVDVDTIKRATSVDATMVVKCKDCENWGGAIFGFVCRKFSGIETRICTHADDFCSYGIRRAGKENE